MTAAAPEIETLEPQLVTKSNVLLVLPATLAAALVTMPFLPNEIAAATVVRICVGVYVTLAAIDFFTRRVPNVVVYPAIAFALAATVIVEPGLAVDTFAGGAAALVVMYALAVIGRGSMGMGDVKAACFGGCVLGAQGGVIALFLGFAIGAVVALPLLLLRIRGRKDSLPLTPFLAAGFVTYGAIFGFLLTS